MKNQICFFILLCPIFVFSQNVKIEGDGYISGNLGVGNDVPEAKIDARGSNNDDAAYLQLGNSDLSHKLLLFPGRLGEPLPFILWKGGDPLRFATDDGGFAERFRIASDGLITVQNRITNLSSPSDPQDAATKAYVDLLESKVASLEAEVEALQGVKDIDNNRYQIVTIGTQTWMAENLKTTRYNDGTVIPLITDGAAWSIARSNGDDAYCWYENDVSNLITYGALYNWNAIDTSSNGNKNVCPTGWHVPTNGEWDILKFYIDPIINGNVNIAGGKMKEAGLAHWNSPNTSGTNESGFGGLPGGYCSANGSFLSIGERGYWWSSTEYNTSNAWYRYLYYFGAFVFKGNFGKGTGMSVRCLRD